MKIIAFHQKHGEAVVEPESADDLWLLSQTIEQGDRVKARTWRKIKLEGERKAEVIKKPVTLEIEVERNEFAGDILRISGKILNQVEDITKGSHHTISIEPGNQLTITKNWLSFQKQRLESAKAKTQLLICLFDREEAHIALVTRDKHQWVSHMKGEVERKGMTENLSKDFYAELRKEIENLSSRFKPSAVIIASPAFWKDELLKNWKTKPSTLVSATVSSGDETALQEVLVREETKSALASARIAEEAKVVEELLKRVAKQGSACYGIKQVLEASSQGCIEMLLLTDRKIKQAREEGRYQEIDAILQAVDAQQGKIMVLDGAQEPGKKVDGIGGIAALLRYKLEA